MEQSYTFNGKSIKFSVDAYLADSTGIPREEMPQVSMKAFKDLLPQLRQAFPITKIMLPVSSLKPTQNEINMDKVLMKLAQHGEVEDSALEFICSRELHFVDGHHRHVQTLIQDEMRPVTCYLFDMNIQELLEFLHKADQLLMPKKDINDQAVKEALQALFESYGMQGPEASPGMGSADFGSPATADAPGTKGSGDIAAGTIKDRDENDDVEKTKIAMKEALNGFLAKFGAKVRTNEAGQKEISVQIDKSGEHVNWSPMNENINEASILDGSSWYGDLRELLENINEAVEEGAKPLPLHFIKESDNVPEFKQCVNLPVVRGFAKIDDEFSCETMEGITTGKAGDYLMQGVDGELYPCDADIWHKTYTEVNDVEELKSDIVSTIDNHKKTKTQQ